MKVLSPAEAQRVYNRLGRLLDTQAFYENRALDLIIEHGQFADARSVFEFGSGTGRFALRLLSEILPGTAEFRAVDLSPTQVHLAQERLSEFHSRAKVSLSDGSPPVGEASGFYDRFISTFVLDLLSERDIALVLGEAHRMLVPGGLLCLSSLSTGSGFVSRTVARLWSAVHRLSPSLVAGCRPLRLRGFLPSGDWSVRFHAHVASFAIPLEIIVAERV